MINRVDEVVASTEELNDVLKQYAADDTQVVDLDAWTTADLCKVQILMDGELQRRADEQETLDRNAELLGLAT
jgi:hypothetical protein